MIAWIYQGVKGFFRIGSDNKAQKRKSDSSNTSPIKRPRLSETNDMEDNNGEDTILGRPALTRSCEVQKSIGKSSTNWVGGGTNCTHTNYVSETSSDSKLNGYNFSNVNKNMSMGPSLSFEGSKTSSLAGQLRRPSLVDRNWVNERSANGNSVNNVTAISPSIFKSWTGFKNSTPLHDSRNKMEPYNKVESQHKRGHQTTNSYLHKKVVPKELAIKQCFRIDEKRKYKEMLSKYVSPVILDTVDLTSEPRHDDVITISDSESNLSRRVELPQSFCKKSTTTTTTTLPINITQFKRPLTCAGVTPRTASQCSSVSSRNMEIGQPWRTLERQVERATFLLDEVTRPPTNQSDRSSQVDLTGSPSNVIVLNDDRSPTNQGSHSSQWRSPRRCDINQSKMSSGQIEMIAIEDSEDESKDYVSQTFKENFARPSLRTLNAFEASAKACPYVRENFVANLLDQSKEKERSHMMKEVEVEVEQFRQRRQEQEAEYNEKITAIIKLTRRLPIPSEEKYIELEEDDDDDDILIEETPRDDWPELTNEQEEQINKAFKCRNPDQVLADGFKLQITARDVATLQGTNWLNDEVINFYFNMIVDRSQKNAHLPPVYAFNTFFYPKVVSGGQKVVRRWTKSVDVFKYSYIILPVHLGVHWCLAVVDFPRKEIRYYDSMGGNNNACLDALLQYLVDEMQDKKQQVFDTNGWKKINVKDIPQQMNGSDCGMFSCKFADYVTKNASITFNQSHMPYFRRRMVYEILTRQLM